MQPEFEHNFHSIDLKSTRNDLFAFTNLNVLAAKPAPAEPQLRDVWDKES